MKRNHLFIFFAFVIAGLFFNPLIKDEYYGDTVIKYNQTDKVQKFLSEISDDSKKYMITPTDSYEIYEEIVDRGEHITEKVIIGKILPENGIEEVKLPKVFEFSVPTKEGVYIYKKEPFYWMPNLNESTNKNIVQLVTEEFEIAYEVVDIYKKSLTTGKSYFSMREFRVLESIVILDVKEADTLS